MNKSGIVNRIAAIVLALMLCAALLPLTIAFAADDITTLAELQTLLENGGTGKLANDIELVGDITSGTGNVTLDLNGNKLSSTAAVASAAIDVISGCNVSITGGDIDNVRIYVEAGGTLEVSDVDFSSCKAAENGGAIEVDGTAEITDCTFNKCTATAYKAVGGAVLARSESEVTITGCEFSECQAISGGAVYIGNTKRFLIEDTTIDDCSAAEKGGALCFERGTTLKEIKNTAITDCSAVNSVIGYGGAIYAAAPVNINGGEISGCSAASGGGVFIDVNIPSSSKIEETTVTGCTASTDEGGGGISVNSDLVLSDSVVTDCSCDNADGGGGGVDVWFATLTLTGDTVVNVNSLNGDPNDIHVESAAFIAVKDPGDNMNIGIYMNDPGAFSDITPDYSRYFYSNNPDYTITLNSDYKLELAPGKSITILPSDNGRITSDRSGVPASDTTDEARTVTLTVVPDTGYKLKTLTVTTDAATPANVPLTKVNDTTYTFTMPTDHNVTVTAEFEKGSSGKETQTITADSPQNFKYGDSGKKITASGPNDGGDLNFSVPADNGVITIDPATGSITILKPGSVDVTVTAAENDKYEEAAETVTVTIGKADLTVTADGKSVRKGNTMPELTYTLSGLVGSDKLPDGYKPACAASDTKTVGKFDITLPAITDETITALYNITYNKGVLEVTEGYKVIEGDGQSYVKGSGNTATFRANGEFALFEKIQVDDKDVSDSDYEKWDGSTYVRLSNKFLETLKIGKHSLTFIYKDGKCSCVFYVTRFNGAPGTGDSFEPLFWINLMLTSGLMMYATATYRKKKYSRL